MAYYLATGIDTKKKKIIVNTQSVYWYIITRKGYVVITTNTAAVFSDGHCNTVKSRRKSQYEKKNTNTNPFTYTSRILLGSDCVGYMSSFLFFAHPTVV